MPDKTPFIGVIDDNKGVRLSLRALLESANMQVRDFGTAAEYLANGDGLDCLVVDVHMPDMGGLELQKELSRRHIPVPVIIVTGQATVPLAVQAMRAGAFDFLEKPFDDEALLDSIGRAIAGRQSPPREMDVKSAIEMMALLTERERDVLNLLAVGETNKVIGHQLGISPRTVEIHRARVLEKMKARNVADLVRTVRVAGALG
jgi:two-component system response regulator FixJ